MGEKKEHTGETSGHPIPEKPKATELADKDLEQVSGGTGGDVTLNKSKTADKAYSQMDGYIKQ